jgi:ribosomal protein S18 acetylase RimI-like enzyme
MCSPDLRAMPLTHRLALPADHEIVLRLMEKFYREERLLFDPLLAPAALAQLLRDSALGEVWLLSVEDQLAGYLVLVHSFILEFGGRQMWIDELYLEPAFRGHGAGRQALRLVEESCRARGVRAIRLEVDRTNPRALHLYQGSGFQLHDRSTMTRIITNSPAD